MVPVSHRTRRVASTGTLVLAASALVATPAFGAKSSSIPDQPTPGQIHLATSNPALERSEQGALAEELVTPDSEKARYVAEIVQHVRPDVLLVNEFDHDEEGVGAQSFQ